MKKKAVVKVPGGLFSGAALINQINNLGKSMEMCKSIKIEVGWTEEGNGDKKKDKKEKKEKKERQTRSSNGQFPNGFCSAMLEVMSAEAQAKIQESETELLRILPVIKIANADQKITLSLKASNTPTLTGIINLINSRKVNSYFQKIDFKKLQIKGANKNRPTLDKFPTLISMPIVELNKLAIDFTRYPGLAYAANVQQSQLTLIKCKLINLKFPLPRTPVNPQLTFISCDFPKPDSKQP